MLDAAGRARLTALLGLPSFGPGSIRARAGGRFLRETLGAIADERRAAGDGDDFFGGLVAALHDRYSAPQARELAVDNAVAFYVAGHETTANALTWTIYLLAAQPGLQDELRSEARSAFASGDMQTLDARLPKLRSVLDESLRLYPPAPRLDREAMADDELAGRPRPSWRLRIDLAILAPPSCGTMGRSRCVRSRPVLAYGALHDAPLPVSAVRSRSARMRGCPVRYRGSVDRAGALAGCASVCRPPWGPSDPGRSRDTPPGERYAVGANGDLMTRLPILFACATLLVAPVAAQNASRPAATPSPKPTRVVARSGRLVTARTSSGGTQSYNCKTPANRKRKICKH